MKSIVQLNKFAVLLFALTLAACASEPSRYEGPPPYWPTRPVSPRPFAPPHTVAIPAGPAGPLAPARVGSYMDGLEVELRRHIQGTGVGVARIGDAITVTVRNDRLFARDGTLDGDAVLQPLSAVLNSYPHTSVMVSGFSDTAGTAEQSLAVSQKRARAIGDALAHAGIAAKRIVSQGFGQTHLKVATGPDKREPRNRRIEILLKAVPG